MLLLPQNGLDVSADLLMTRKSLPVTEVNMKLLLSKSRKGEGLHRLGSLSKLNSPTVAKAIYRTSTHTDSHKHTCLHHLNDTLKNHSSRNPARQSSTVKMSRKLSKPALYDPKGKSSMPYPSSHLDPTQTLSLETQSHDLSGHPVPTKDQHKLCDLNTICKGTKKPRAPRAETRSFSDIGQPYNGCGP
jgi:hypothetical protein